MELSAAISHWTARARALGSRGRSVSLRSPMYSTMAPDSNSTKPSSSITGTCPKGCRARYSGSFWSPCSRRRLSYGNPASSSAQRTRRSRTWPRAKSGTHLNAETVITGTLLGGREPKDVPPTVDPTLVTTPARRLRQSSRNQLLTAVLQLSAQLSHQHLDLV